MLEYPLTRACVETLPNGLTLIMDPDPAAPVVSVQAWVETGSIHEDALLGCGLSHFLEHMVFKGTRDYGPDELANVVQAAGGHWNAYTTFGRTVYYIDGPSDSLDTFLRCLSGLVFFPIIPESEFEREKDVIRREIDMGLDDPDHASIQLMLRTAFQRDPRRYPVIGYRHRFDSLSYENLTDYHRARYTTDRVFVVISGDFDPESARAGLVELTADCQAGCGREPWIASDPPVLGPRSAVENFKVPTSRVSMTWKTPSLAHPDAPAFEVLAGILGRGRSSRLQRSLRDEQGLVLEISASSWIDSSHEGLFSIHSEVHPENHERVVDAVMDQIVALREGSLDDEIAKAKRQIAAAQFRPLTSASGRASDLASNWHEARNLNFTRDYLRAIEAVDEQRVRKLAESLDPSRLIHTQIHPEGLKSSGSRAHAKNQLSEVDVRMLPNGLPVAFLVDRRVPMLHAQWAGKAGLCSENRENNGLNQLLAAVLPKGSVKRDAQEIASMLESLGASMAASSGNNAMLLHAGGLADDSATIIDAMCDVMLAPRLANEVIAHEKSCQLASIEEAMNEPVHAAFSGLRRTAFCGEGYGLDALGEPESLARLDRNALSEHHARHFTVSDSAFAIVGDIDPEMLFDQLSALLAEMPMGESWQPPKSSRGSGDLEIKLPKRQAVLAIGFHGPSVHCPDRYAMSMIQSYLSDMAGPLFTRIREDLGLAYQIGATQFQGYHDGLFTLYLATAPEQLELARHEMMREISRLCSSGIPSEAMERVRASIISGLALQQQSLGNCARQIALDMVLGNPPDQFRRMTGIYQAIRAEEVQDAATRYFSQSPVTCTVLPAKSDG